MNTESLDPRQLEAFIAVISSGSMTGDQAPASGRANVSEGEQPKTSRRRAQALIGLRPRGWNLEVAEQVLKEGVDRRRGREAALQTSSYAAVLALIGGFLLRFAIIMGGQGL